MKFSKIDSSYLKKGCRLVWHDPVNGMWVAGTLIVCYALYKHRDI